MDDETKPQGKSPYAKKGKRPFKYEEIDRIDAAKATGDEVAERRAVTYFNNKIRRQFGWDPSRRS